MNRKPTYEELEQRVKDLEKEAVECKRTEEIAKSDLIILNDIINTAADGLCLIDKDFNVVRLNKAFTTLLGISEDEALKKKCYEIFPTSLCNTPNCLLIRILGGEKQIEHNIEKENKDGIKIPGMLVAFPYRGGGEEIVGIVEAFRDLTELKKIGESLQLSEERYRTVVEDQTEVISRFRVDGTFTFVNEVFCRFFGKSSKGLLGKKWQPVALSEDLAMIEEKLETLSKDSPIVIIENRIYSGSGEIRWMQFINRGFFDKEGQLIEIQSVGRDINDRKLAEEKLAGYRDRLEEKIKERTAELEDANLELQKEISERKKVEEKIQASLKEKELLLQEIHHRVKNNMQIISSLLKLQSSSIGDERVTDVLRACRGRVQTMAFVHETLYDSDTLADIDFKTYISKVANQIFQSYGTGKDRVKLEVDTEDIKLGIEEATPLGLITNELATNSLKYAFPENRSGAIAIRIRAVEQDSIEFVFSDNGIGIPEGLDWRNTDSLGLRLVILLAENQLDGTVSLDRGKGTHFTVRFRHENQ